MGASDGSAPQEGSECTALMTCTPFSEEVPPIQPNLKKRKSATRELTTTIKPTISKCKSRTPKKPSQNTKSSKVLVPVSIGKVLKPFWNEYSKEVSQKLWLPTETDYVDSPVNSSRSCSRTLESNSWFSIRTRVPKASLATTCLPLRPSLSQDITASVQRRIERNACVTKCSKPPKKKLLKKSNDAENEEEEKIPAGKTIKIRLFPSKTQSQTLRKWFGVCRWTYNKCVAACTRRMENIEGIENGQQRELTDANAKALRAQFLNSDAPNIPAWVLETPYDVRDEAMRDFVKAFQTQKLLVKQGKRQFFKMKFRSKRMEQSIVIHSKHWKRGLYFHPKFFGKIPIKSSEPLPEKLGYDSRLIRDRNGKYFLCIPKPLNDKLDYIPPKEIIALDPGVRTFMTGYDSEGRVLEVGNKDMNRIYRLCHHMDEQQSLFSTTNNGIKARKRFRMKRKWKRTQTKVRNLIDEVHKKLTLELVKSYKTILLPKFETSQMVKRGKRKIRSKTVRAMLTWSHYRFQNRLLDKTREYRQCKVLLVTEEYTSKTCGACGNIHAKLGGNKIFKCPYCGICLDRDLNAARNILIKFLTEHHQ